MLILYSGLQSNIYFIYFVAQTLPTLAIVRYWLAPVSIPTTL